MASSRFQQSAAYKSSGSHEQPRSDANDTVHHRSGPHYPFPPYHQEDFLRQAFDFEALVLQFPFTLSSNTPLWNTQVDGLSTLDHELPLLPNDHLRSPTSSITPPPFPTTPPPLSNVDQFNFKPSQVFTTPVEDSLSQETIHQEQPSAYVPFSNTWDENHLVGQMATLHDRAHRYTSYFKSFSPESHLAEDISSLVSNGMTTPHVSTLSPLKIGND